MIIQIQTIVKTVFINMNRLFFKDVILGFLGFVINHLKRFFLRAIKLIIYTINCSKNLTITWFWKTTDLLILKLDKPFLCFLQAWFEIKKDQMPPVEYSQEGHAKIGFLVCNCLHLRGARLKKYVIVVMTLRYSGIFSFYILRILV